MGICQLLIFRLSQQKKMTDLSSEWKDAGGLAGTKISV